MKHVRFCMITLAALISVVALPTTAVVQPFEEDFESGSSEGWAVFDGTMFVTSAQAHSGTYSLRVDHPPATEEAGIAIKSEMAANYGVYEAWFYIDDCLYGEALLAFQAVDENDHYSVILRPNDPDGEFTVLLTRAVGGAQTYLVEYLEPGLIQCQEWTKLRVHRHESGPINAFVENDGVETQILSIDDLTITEARGMAVGGWGGVYVDDVSFQELCCEHRVGDAKGMGGDEPTLSDVVVMIDAKFITGTCDGLLACLTEADINQSGGTEPDCADISLSDIAILVDYLFITGPSLGLVDCL